MLYMTIYTWRPENREAVISRFKQTSGAPPAAGVKRLGRWSDLSGGRVFVVSEADDPVALATGAQRFADLASIEIVPVLNDEQLVRSLA